MWLMVLLSGLLALNLSNAAEAVPLKLTLAEARQRALEKNLQLKIQRLDPLMAKLSLRAAQGVYDPLLTFETRRENLADLGGYDPADFSKDAIYEAESHIARAGITGLTPIGMTYSIGGDYANSFGTRNYVYFDSYNINLDLFISQPLLRGFWIDQPRMLIQISRKQIRSTTLALRHAVMDVLQQLEQGYFELMYAQENLAVYRNLHASRQRLLEAVQRLARGGLLTEADVNLAESQLAATAAELEQAQEMVRLAQNNLRLIMGEPFAENHNAPLEAAEILMAIPQANEYSQSCRTALAQRADLAWLRTEAEKAEVDLKFRYNQLFPSLNLVAGWGRRGAHTLQDFWMPPRASSGPAWNQLFGGDSPSDMVGVVFNMPLSRTAERANHRLSRQRKEQALLMVRQKEEMVMREVADALAQADAAWRRLQRQREAVHHACQVLTAEEKKLMGGKSTVLFVLQFQTDLAMARSRELRAMADYNQACARLRFAEGTIIEASGMQMEIAP